MQNNIHLSNCYFNIIKRDTLSDDEKFIFSNLVSLANELILKINNSNMEDSLKERKFKEIKFKITQCHSLSLALEYYLDFEFEINKINSKIDEYSKIKFIKKEDKDEQVVSIDTETKQISKINSDTKVDRNIKEIKNTVIELDTKRVKDMTFYLDKYSSKNNISKEFALDIISHIR